MRFRIRRNHDVHPLARRESYNTFQLYRDEEGWAVRHARPVNEPEPGRVHEGSLVGGPEPAPGDEPEVEHVAPPGPPGPSEDAPAMTTPPPPLFSPPGNGLRSQATAGDARAERLIRSVRTEVADLKQVIERWQESREDMVAVDIEAVREDPAAAATLPPPALVRAILAAHDRITELEREIEGHRSAEAALREELAHLNEEHSYTQGRLETLQDVISALHGNLDDLRYERNRQRPLDGAVRDAVDGREAGSGRLQDQRGGLLT